MVIKDAVQQIRWARRVSRNKIRRLYETDAQGILDEELIDDVACAIYARCESILTVTEASKGRVKCPCCGNVILRRSGSKEEVLKCNECSWEITWGAYFQSYHRKQLHGGGAVDVLRDFIRQFPTLRSPQEKMILIDRLIHECHKSLQEGVYTRPVAVNLIAGKMTQIIILLDDLAYGAGSTPGAKEVYTVWRKRMNDARERWGMDKKQPPSI